MNLRQRKKDKLRINIIDSSLELFFKQGFDKTTIEDIIFPLEISKRTFFRYFPTKEDVVLSVYDNLIKDTLFTETMNMKYDPIHTIKLVFSNLATLYENEHKNNNYYYKIEHLISKTPSIRAKRIEKLIQCGGQICNLCGIKTNNKQTTFQNNLIVYFSMGIFESAVTTWIASNGKSSLSKNINDGFKLIGRKIQSAKPA